MLSGNQLSHSQVSVAVGRNENWAGLGRVFVSVSFSSTSGILAITWEGREKMKSREGCRKVALCGLRVALSGSLHVSLPFAGEREPCTESPVRSTKDCGES